MVHCQGLVLPSKAHGALPGAVIEGFQGFFDGLQVLLTLCEGPEAGEKMARETSAVLEHRSLVPIRSLDARVRGKIEVFDPARKKVSHGFSIANIRV